MAKNKKTISITKFEKTLKENFPSTITVQWHGLDIEVTPTIPMVSMLEFVSSVVDACFMDDGEYVPEVRDAMIRMNVLTRYANFSLPEGIKKPYEFVYAGEADCAFNAVFEHINQTQYFDICDAIAKRIDYRLESYIGEVQDKLEELVKMLDSAKDGLQGVVDGFSDDDIAGLIKAVSKDGGIDEEKIIAAYLEQREPAEAVADEPAG